MKRPAILVVWLSLLNAAPVAFAQGILVGVPVGYTPGTAPFVRINPTTGAYASLNTVGNSYHALAADSAGALYGGSFSVTAENGRVARLDANTGVPQAIYNAVTPGAGDIRGLAFDAANRLFAVVNRNDTSGAPTLPDDLYAIELTGQTTSLIGSFGYEGVQGLDFSPGGELYAWDVDFGLLLVDPDTGAATDVNPSVGGTAAIQSIAFAPDGRLFGARERLFAINPATGTFTAIGPGGGPDLRGIEWLVPEPASLAVAVLGLFGLASVGRLTGANIA